MTQKYYNVKETAEKLGVSEADITQMQSNRQLHGYRDGADWKFKAEDVDELASQQSAETAEIPGPDQSDVLLSEVELGASDAGASGTVIGMEQKGAEAGGDLELALEPGPAAGQDDMGSKVSQFEELDLTLEEDLALEEAHGPASPEAASNGSSSIDLAGDEMEDDDLVLGGSSAGSDITIGGDSGISLVDPTDSGLSLDEPLDLGGSGAESLELGEDDLISLGEGAETDAPTELKTDDDFLLTPLEEAGDEESESGSQVIALDTEGADDEAATMIGSGPAAGSMAAMLDEDLSAEPADDMAGIGAALDPAALGSAMASQPGAMTQGAAATPSAAVLPEAPYSVWNIVWLALCAIFLIGCGMFTYDLLRNMWSWDSTYTANSWMMDTILSWFES